MHIEVRTKADEDSWVVEEKELEIHFLTPSAAQR